VSGFSEFLDRLSGSPVTIDQWQLEKMALAGRRFELHFYVPGLPAALRGFLGPSVYSTAEQALAGFVQGMKGGAPVAVIPEGPYVFAQVEEPVFAL
jgi:lactate racemase